MQILIVGHRGAGKSTLGRHLADRLGFEFVDIDDVIEERTQKTCAEIIADDEATFRDLETKTLAKTLNSDADLVVSPGAGLGEIPPGPLTVFLERDGWEETAKDERHRLRPELTWEQEVGFMKQTREPKWRDAAHLHYVIPRGRTAERAANDLASLMAMMRRGPNEIAKKSWLVPQGEAQVARAERDVLRLGLAGVEVRSDMFSTLPDIAVPMLASVRSADGAWIRHAAEAAQAIDVDLDFLDAFEASGALDAQPRDLLLSVHPSHVDPDDLNALVAAARDLQTRRPEWAPHIALKYAPVADDFGSLGMARALVAPLRRAGVPVTFLPQGERHAWYRPLAARENPTNYVSATLRPSRFGSAMPTASAWDLQDWLPHIFGPLPDRYDVLVGDPVEKSQGDLWHRRRALELDQATGYLKVAVATEAFDEALNLFSELPIRGISVTSPLKSRAAFICPNDADYGPLLGPEDAARARVSGHPVRNGNTLVRAGDRWLATDTDESGMAASLRWFEEREIGPATVAIFGQGGVSEALVRAIEASDWFLVHHASAREGWTDGRPPFVTIVVNASGSESTVHDGAPRCRGWLDLHYVDVRPPPEDAVHLNGDVFFDAQAEAQRAFWAARG